jgi:signal peptidase II
MSNSKPNALSWLLLSVVVIVLDQWSKNWVVTSLPEFTAVPVIDGFWNWYRTYNTGAAFSFLSDAGGWQKYLFTVLAFGISGLLGYWLARTPRREWRTALPYALVIGGAVGNVIDRLIHGKVIDFIQWYWRDHYWPAFNIADSAIVAGAVGIALFGLVGGSKRSADAGAPGLKSPHGRPASQSPRFLRRCRPRHRDRQARPGNAGCADLRAPRSRAQPLRRRRPQAPRRDLRRRTA